MKIKFTFELLWVIYELHEDATWDVWRDTWSSRPKNHQAAYILQSTYRIKHEVGHHTPTVLICSSASDVKFVWIICLTLSAIFLNKVITGCVAGWLNTAITNYTRLYSFHTKRILYKILCLIVFEWYWYFEQQTFNKTV